MIPTAELITALMKDFDLSMQGIEEELHRPPDEVDQLAMLTRYLLRCVMHNVEGLCKISPEMALVILQRFKETMDREYEEMVERVVSH